MNRNEIQTLIDEKIAGQGNQVDVGGALAEILSQILNLAAAGANVQSDWNENSSDNPAFIKNKPSIPAAQIQSDWAQDDDASLDYIKNKPAIKVFDVRWYPDTRIPRPEDAQNAEIAGYVQAGKLHLICMRHYEETANSYIVWPIISGYYDAANKKLQYTVQIPEEMSGGTGANKTTTFTYVEENVNATPIV